MVRIKYHRKPQQAIKRGEKKPSAHHYDLSKAAKCNIEREKPGRGFISLIMKREMETFIKLLPEWEDLSLGIETVVLAPGEDGVLGWRSPGVVGLCAWPRIIEWDDCDHDFYNTHKDLFAKLEIPCAGEDDHWYVGFTDLSASAFQLIHVFVQLACLHRNDVSVLAGAGKKSRGSYLRSYVNKWENEIFKRYLQHFKLY